MKDKREHGRAAGLIISISIVVLAVVLPPVLSKVIPAWEHTWLGWKPIVVTGNSMEPTLRQNGVVIVYATPWDKLEVMDVITFALPDGNLNTHRVIEKDGAHIRTKGDNPHAPPDAGWVTRDSYRYKVIIVWNWVAWVSDHRWVAYAACLALLVAAAVTAGVLIARRAGRRRNLFQDYMEPEADDTDCIACLDELLTLMDPLLARHQAETRETPPEPKEKETTTHEPETAQVDAPAAEDDSDDALDWDAWAFMQLRQPAPPPGDAAPADRGKDPPGALPGESAEHGQQLSAPGEQRLL
jgi:signal peptidase I